MKLSHSSNCLRGNKEMGITYFVAVLLLMNQPPYIVELRATKYQ